MNLLYKIFFVFAAALLLLGCSQKELSPVDYVKWMEKDGNGFRKTKAIDKLEFEVQMKPVDYILLKEENIDPGTKKQDFENEKKQLGDMQYFTLKIKTPEGTDPLKFQLANKDEFYARVKYYSFDIQSDLSLVDGKDTIHCVLAHFERNYGLAPEITCLLGFPAHQKNSTQNDKSFIYYDRVFNSGNLIFGFSKQDILNAPKLKS